MIKKLQKAFYALVLSLFFTTITNATIINVPSNYQTIQGAINHASQGDTVLVAPGIYYENLNFRSKGIILASHFILNHNLSIIDSTIINGSQPVNADTASCIIIAYSSISTTNDTSAAVIGFTITAGAGTKWNDEHGPGNIYREGGGILIQYNAPRIMYNKIINNHVVGGSGLISAGGGGIRCGDSNPKIIHNFIRNNSGRYGGAIVLNYCGATIKNNIIANNYGGEDYGAGGIWINSNSQNRLISIENNDIIYNTSAKWGGGILFWGCIATCKNNILWGNVCPTGSQIYKRDQTTITLKYNDIQGGFAGVGNINSDPLFSDSCLFLSSNSPCIDAGDTSATYADPANPANPTQALFPAKGSLRNDIGVYGGKLSNFIGIFSSNIFVGFDKNNYENIIKTYLSQNYPNPVKSSSNIQLFIKESDFVTLKIYNINGSLKEILINQILESGTYNIPININKFDNGVYFYTLETKNIIDTKKLIVNK